MTVTGCLKGKQTFAVMNFKQISYSVVRYILLSAIEDERLLV